MLEQLGGVIGACCGMALEMQGADAAGRPNRGPVVDVGWPVAGESDVFLRLRRDWATGVDPFFAACIELVRGEGRLVTRRRRDLVSDQVWHNSGMLNESSPGAGLDDLVASYCPLPDGSWHAMLMGRREAPPFEIRHRRLVHLLHHGLSLHFGKRLGMLGTCAADGLSPRMRQVLSLLCVGDSEKQVAAKLTLSPHTVHTYIKRLHKHFNVASRGELLARTRGVELDATTEFPTDPLPLGQPE